MNKTNVHVDSARINVSDQVRFPYHGKDVQGVVAKKGRTHAHVVSFVFPINAWRN
jgi:hypothetical protein